MVETEAEVRREITDVLIVEKKKGDRPRNSGGILKEKD